MKTEPYRQIKNRMIKKAASIWGVAANEIESSFDPVVSLLISACASEILKIEAELNESQNRITEKMIRLMTPESTIGSKPSHAILYAQTVDSYVVVKPEYLFYFKKKTATKSASLKRNNIFFSPVQDFKLVNANIKYIASGNSFFELDMKNQKQLVSKKNSNFMLPDSTIYFGIESSLKDLQLQDVSFYFEIEDVDNRALFYHYLQYSEWFINDKKIDFVTGFFNSEESDKINLESIFKDDSNKMFSINEQTLNYYKRHFVTLKSKKEKFKPLSYPEIEDFVVQDAIDLESNITWLKIVFPRVVSNLVLQNTFCSLNAFPVLNRELNTFSYQMREFINILPIKTDDYFLDIKSIQNTSGKTYISKEKDVQNSGKGTYTFRGNSVGKLDHRSAKEYLTHLIELLKDESASFSFLNNDFLHTSLNDLNQLISLLEKRVSNSKTDFTKTNFVMLNPYTKKENLLIEFWTTNGEEGNNIKSGSDISIYKAIGIKQSGSYLLTTSFNGKNNLDMDERLNAYRRSLLSRDRIVTKEDIKVLCYELYNDKITKVEIKRAFTNNIDLKKGITQCIEVYLHANKNAQLNETDWHALNSNLLLLLEKKSVNIFPYKIKIVN